ncbi:MAG: hypothetical protein R6U28_00930 [Cyclonatronaceae bacterium]
MLTILTKKLTEGSAADYLIAGRNLGVIACVVVVVSEWLGAGLFFHRERPDQIPHRFLPRRTES